MAKRQSGLSAQGTRAGKNARPIPDNQIDFSDIPQSTDEELRRARQGGTTKNRTASAPVNCNQNRSVSIAASSSARSQAKNRTKHSSMNYWSKPREKPRSALYYAERDSEGVQSLCRDEHKPTDTCSSKLTGATAYSRFPSSQLNKRSSATRHDTTY